MAKLVAKLVAKSVAKLVEEGELALEGGALASKPVSWRSTAARGQR